MRSCVVFSNAIDVLFTILLLLPAGEMVHYAVNAEPFAENHVEETVRKKALPYPDEMVRERYSLEILLLLDCPDDLRGGLFRLQ